MTNEFDEKTENELLALVQKNYGAEVFTPGLERTRELYRPFLQLVKERQIKVATIAGTNGKGQTAHTLGYFLNKSGQSYALWTSPHILSLRERFSFDGKEISYQELRQEIENTHEALKKEIGLVVSFYEFLFLVFLKMAFKRNIQYLLLEVGLGGRLDAVNHFDADVACVTSISRDHQAILGNRFDLILAEKIAVSRPGKTLLTQFHLNYLNQLTHEYCENKNVVWKSIREEKKQNYFEQNQAMARALFRELVPDGNLSDHLPIPEFKGRREEMTFRGNALIFIGAHNIDGVRSMTELFPDVSKSSWPTQLLISFSKRPVSEIEVMLKSMAEHFGENSKLILTSFEHPKAMDVKALHEVEEHLNKINKGMFDFVTDWKSYLNQVEKQNILVCGSYYFVGEIQRFIHTYSRK